MKRALILLLFVISSSLFAAQINVRIFSSLSSQEILKSGTLYFFSLVNKQCGTDFEPKFSIQQFVGTAFNNFDQYKSDGLLTPGNKTQFQYYQHDFWDLLQDKQFHRAKFSLDLIEVASLSSHCAFAFPEIQFTKDQADILKNTLKNRIIFSEKKYNCGAMNRLVAHELAHIFIQDNPAHTCMVANKLVKCPDNNLLSDLVYLNNSHPGIPYWDEAPKMTPSTGTQITEIQCQSIIETYKQMQ